MCEASPLKRLRFSRELFWIFIRTAKDAFPIKIYRTEAVKLGLGSEKSPRKETGGKGQSRRQGKKAPEPSTRNKGRQSTASWAWEKRLHRVNLMTYKRGCFATLRPRSWTKWVMVGDRCEGVWDFVGKLDWIWFCIEPSF